MAGDVRIEGTVEDAIKWAKKAVETSDEKSKHKYLDTLAACYAKKGQYEEAILYQDLAYKMSNSKKEYEQKKIHYEQLLKKKKTSTIQDGSTKLK